MIVKGFYLAKRGWAPAPFSLSGAICYLKVVHVVAGLMTRSDLRGVESEDPYITNAVGSARGSFSASAFLRTG